MNAWRGNGAWNKWREPVCRKDAIYAAKAPCADRSEHTIGR